MPEGSDTVNEGEAPRVVATADGGVAPSIRPSTPRVLGVLSIVFGGLLTCRGFCHARPACGLATGRSEYPDEYEQRTIREYGPEAGAVVIESVRAWTAVFAPSGIAVAALSAALVVIGVGQLRYRKWARRAAVVWAIVALSVLVAMAVAFVAVVGPAQAEAMRVIKQAQRLKDASPPSEDFGTIFSLSMVAMLAMFLAPYPIVVVALSTRRYVAEAMRE